MSEESTAAALWLSLVPPSLFVVDKYGGWPGTIAYAAIAAAGVLLASRLHRQWSARQIFWLGLGTWILIVLVFALSYPVLNTHVPGTGSDDDDALNIGARALMAGHSPYGSRTYLGNLLHQLPGSFVLAAPFVLMGTSALQTLFWLPMFFLAAGRQARSGALALCLAWLVLGLSPEVMHQTVTGTGYVANTISVLLGLWWLVRTDRRDLAAMGWGLALASRANFLFLLPLAFSWLRQHRSLAAAVRAAGLALLVAVLVTLPFYLHDPAHFAPVEASDRVFRFDNVLPHMGLVVLVGMAGLALGLSFTAMDTTALFRNCAIVQAWPVAMGLLLTSWQTGRLDWRYTSYATFFAWFVLMAIAARAEPARGAASPHRAGNAAST
jgi:hypothetical protein